MPGFDRTGPAGAGAMTGGGRGRCTSLNRSSAEYSGFTFGRGRRMGRGGGMRRGQGLGGYDFAPRYGDPQDDVQHLQREAQFLEERLRQIQNRIDRQSQKPEE